MKIKPEHLDQLELELKHIFDSGANEARVFNMIQIFIESRGKLLFTDNVIGQNKQCDHNYQRVVRGGEFQGNQCDCGDWEDLT